LRLWIKPLGGGASGSIGCGLLAGSTGEVVGIRCTVISPPGVVSNLTDPPVKMGSSKP